MNFRVCLISCVLIISFMMITTVSSQTPPMTEALHWMGRIVVQFSEEMNDLRVDEESGIALLGYQNLDALARQYNVYHMEQLIPGSTPPTDPSITDISRIYVLEFPIEIDIQEVAQAYAEDPHVLTAEPYQIHKTEYVPSDLYFSGQWSLDVMNAELAYDFAQGSEDVIVGIVDSGTDTLHNDLKSNLWVNPGEDLNGSGIIEPEEWNGIDDDGNFYVDDFWGWNVWQNNNNIMDNDPQWAGHGTHCAGDASAVTDNALGVASLGWKARIQSAKAGDGQYVYAADAGIIYCVNNGANIISLSFGSYWYSSYEQTIINNAWDNGVMIFAAAGNDNSTAFHYPSAYNNVISVAATEQNDQKASFSNYGTSIDICAPGVSIMSTTPNNTYYSYSGTSMSCPIAAGLAALIWSAKPEWTNAEVMNQIFTTCVDIDPLNPGYAGLLGWGRIDAGAALSTLFPNLSYTEQEFDDSAGNGDGRPDPGESVDFLITLENSSRTVEAVDVAVTLECDDPDITITQGVCNLGNIPTLGSSNNHSDPFHFTVDENAEPHEVTFVLTITEAGTGLTLTDEITQMIGRPSIVLVDDDGGLNFNTWYASDLTTLGYVYDHWDVAQQGEISNAELQLYPLAIWHTSNADNPLSANEQTLIEAYLNNDGKLFLVGEDIDEELAGTAFYSDVLHAVSLGSSGSPQVIGVEDDPISAGDTLLMAGSGGANNNYSPSTIDALGGAYTVFTFVPSALGAGIRWIGTPGRLVYFSFNFEAVSGASPTPRTEVLSSIITWLESNVGIKSTVTDEIPQAYELGQNYPNPFNPTTEIAFDLPASGSVRLSVFDLFGRRVATVLNSHLAAGNYRMPFDASGLSSGIYLYRLETPGFTASKKMVVLK